MNEPPLDATALASWLDLSDEDREVLTVGFWVVSQALAPPDVPRSEEYVAAQDAIRTVWSATRSGVVKGVFSTLWLDVRMLESEPDRMDSAFLRVAEMHKGIAGRRSRSRATRSRRWSKQHVVSWASSRRAIAVAMAWPSSGC